MIDFQQEELLTLGGAVDRIGRLTKKRASRATVYRWATTGCLGVVLETVRVGRTRYTSEAAIHRFIRSITDGVVDRGPARSRTAREASSEKAGKGLDAVPKRQLRTNVTR